ncbi:MAG: RdgB/HAM1 family non-canonical purine NTP pyrophosphatase [Sphaerochaeta sp.]|nr:RdgB/HAM1 family non-canonical purine NTP pyrophosphatase [Sphaerochaeta sp.]MCH3919805.1 RdgB/HAM1 family non-canonical purine NTP pyrophosphatase [Sphaerochaeta sp.]MCI2076433.1 RdgB/HAM1 family non-canonical purine NTP pyrophosphatase [Sphaerochaeta sp.]MCI2096631.1 RdgB/HAM1 family non-canonical purine NTP pyrophosphatase [Sphaerochaeta sp.]MCI2103627.1 RdgB/HAM1 family non-canonical purine NTP pyrophosphatase [Sphaerochaeta sp.]
MKILLASSNTHKKTEIARMLKQHEVLLPSDLGITFSCDETGKTFIENAMLKANALHAAAPKGVVIMADDSGLCVDALGGRPGIYSARYGMKGGIELSAAEKNALLLSELSAFPQWKDRTAHFVCALVVRLDDHRIFVFQEAVDGHIMDKPSGTAGFGYDPVFFIDQAGCGMAELPEGEKDNFSHRGRAIRDFLKEMQ